MDMEIIAYLNLTLVCSVYLIAVSASPPPLLTHPNSLQPSQQLPYPIFSLSLMASLAPSLTSMPLSDSTLCKPSPFHFRSAPLRPSIYNLPRLSISISLQRTTFHLTPLVAQTSGWTQQEVEDQQLDSDSDILTGEEEGQWVGQGTDGDSVVEEEEEYIEPPEEAKLFVGGISFDVTTDSLAELFNQAGTVEIAEV
jgi:hypothetical protein